MVINQSDMGTMLFREKKKKKMGKVRIHHVSVVQANKCNIHLFIPAENTTLAH